MQNANVVLQAHQIMNAYIEQTLTTIAKHYATAVMLAHTNAQWISKMPRFRVFIADWDKMRSLDDNRDTLWASQHNGFVFGEDLYLDPYVLEAESIEDAYRILNIGHPEDYQRRSMSVGDVIVDDSNQAWVCKREGWRKVCF